jgi:hypothetical protein
MGIKLCRALSALAQKVLAAYKTLAAKNLWEVLIKSSW